MLNFSHPLDVVPNFQLIKLGLKHYCDPIKKVVKLSHIK